MTAYLVVIQNKDGGYRVQLRQHVAAKIPLMQSRRESMPSRARREAERVFGPLDWRKPQEIGLDQDYVESVAVVSLGAGIW